MQLWSTFGMSLLIFLAGLSTVPKDMLEAARLEGAKLWQVWWYVDHSGAAADHRIRRGGHHDRRADLDVRADLCADRGRAGHGDDAARIPDLAGAGQDEPARLRGRDLDGAVRADGRLAWLQIRIMSRNADL